MSIGGLVRDVGEVLEAALGVSLHALGALHPASRADLAVLVGELEGLNETDGLLDVAADGQVVDSDLAEGTLGVNDEETAEGNTLVLEQHAVVARDLLAAVGDQRQLQVGTETTLLARLRLPGQVGEVGVGREGENGGVDAAETSQSVIVLDNLSGADKGKVHGVEQQDDPMSEYRVSTGSFMPYEQP